MKTFALAALVLITACNESAAKEPPKAAPIAARAVPASALSPVFAPYEQARAALASDDLAGAQKAAAAVEAGATTLASTDAAKKATYDAIAAAAAKLKASTEIEPARLAFGEISRGVVTLLATADPAVQKPWFVMECPMAKGYQKWAQLEEKLENPYMGKKMLECGSRSSW